MLHHKNNTYIKSSIFFNIRVFASDIIIILSFYHKKLLCKYILYFFHNIFILSLYFDNLLMFSHFCVYQHTIYIRTKNAKPWLIQNTCNRWNIRKEFLACMKMYDLKNKQVINENDCRILGCVIDIDFEPSNGCINSIIVPGPARLCGVFGREFVYVIPFHCIKSIGKDIVLVNVCLDKHKEKC